MMNKLLKIYTFFQKKRGGVNLFKTLYWNIKLFGISNGLKFPILIYRNTNLQLNKHNIKINTKLNPGLIHIGKQCTKLIDKYTTTYVCIDGMLQIDGFCLIGSGSKLLVPGKLYIGKNFSSSGNLCICCENEICIGEDCMFSWDVSLMDTDYHPIILDYQILNPSKPIYIGNRVWIGCGNVVLKGVEIGNDIIISAGNILRHSLKESNAVYGSKNYVQILRNGTHWSKDVIQ